jgi:20S proteasome alpha/beta subunit
LTVIVGILCQNGVVMATDGAATFGTGTLSTIGQQAVRKLIKVNDQILYSSTGAVGISQIIVDGVKRMWEAGSLKGGKAPTPEAMMNAIGKEINQLVLPYLSTAHFQQAVGAGSATAVCKSLMAMPSERKACLFQFDVNGSPERASVDLPFVALGSGQMIADPFLALLKRLLWSQTEPTVAEGRMAAVWTIDHVRRTNPGGVGGDIQLATLECASGGAPKITVVGSEEINEHQQRIESAEQALVNELRSTGAVPQPPAAPVPTEMNPNPARPG